MDNLAHIVAMHKQDIFSLLKNNMGEWADDEKILKDLEDSLEKKKNTFETNLWKSAAEIDLTKNDNIIDLREKKINNTLPW
jgi:hypothetical protein